MTRDSSLDPAGDAPLDGSSLDIGNGGASPNMADESLVAAMRGLRRKIDAQASCWETEAQLEVALAGMRRNEHTSDGLGKDGRDVGNQASELGGDGLRGIGSLGKRTLQRVSSRLLLGHSESSPRFATAAFGIMLGVALCVGLGVVGWSVLMRSVRGHGIDSNLVHARTYTTRSGEQATVTVAGRVCVTLTPRTTLTVRGNVVHLTGEALFTVVPHSTAPVVVRTSRAMIRVLGTTFTVRQYATDQDTRVAVVEGRVAIRPRSSSAERGDRIASAGEAYDVTDSTINATAIRDVEPLLEWTRGRLVFQDAPLPEVLTALERWYGYQFRVVDSTLMRERVTIGVSTTTPADALTALGRLLSADFTIDAHVVTVSRRPIRVISTPTPERRSWRQALSTPTEAGR